MEFLIAPYLYGVIIHGVDGTPSSESLTIPSIIQGLPVLALADNAFQNSEFQYVSVEGTLQRIGNNAFKGSELTSFTGFAKRISPGAFSDCSNLSIVSGLDNVAVISSSAFSNSDPIFICSHNTMLYTWCISTNHRYNLIDVNVEIPLLCPNCNSSWNYRKTGDFVEGICPSCKTRLTVANGKKVVIATPLNEEDDDIIQM